MRSLAILDSTPREGEQFAGAFFSLEQRLTIARLLDAIGVPLIERIRAAGRYVRFSAEDAFRSDLVDLLTVFDAVVEAGVQRIGLPDTVGIATPRQVEQLVRICKERYPQVGIEFHGHNDTGCAIANTVAALEAGADCLDVSVLGIGERDWIASLTGLIAQLYIHHPHLLVDYDLTQLVPLD